MPTPSSLGSRRVSDRKCRHWAEYVLFGFVGVVVVGMLFVFGVVAVLGWRHDEAFARQQLAAMGYERVEIGARERHSSTRFLPTETYFPFSRLKGGELERGYLVCRAQFHDLNEQRCEVKEESA